MVEGALVLRMEGQFEETTEWNPTGELRDGRLFNYEKESDLL